MDEVAGRRRARDRRSDDRGAAHRDLRRALCTDLGAGIERAGLAGTVRVVNRVGLRICLDVGLGREPASGFRIVNVAANRTADGKPEVIARVHNSGSRALDLNGSLALSDGPGPLSAGPSRRTWS